MPVYNRLYDDPAPVYPIDRTPEFAVDEVKFGEGYVLERESGMNARTDTVTLRYEGLTKTERALLYAFFDAHSPTTPFILPAVFDGIGGLYTCPRFTHRKVGPMHWEIVATLKQSHG